MRRMVPARVARLKGVVMARKLHSTASVLTGKAAWIARLRAGETVEF